MTASNRLYKMEDGTKVPLFEADYPMEFFVYRKHRRSAIIGDPKNCIEAKGICELPGVKEAHIGSGKDAYVIFEPNRSRNHLHALHFIIPARSAKVRDTFEQNKAIRTQALTLVPPTDGQTLEYHNAFCKERRRKIQAGEVIPKKQNKARVTRVMRIGVSPRPRAIITKNVVSLGEISVMS